MEKEKQPRIKRAANGTRTQKMMAFRLDADLIRALSQVSNKGRLINKLLSKFFSQHPPQEWNDTDEVDPHPNDLRP